MSGRAEIQATNVPGYQRIFGRLPVALDLSGNRHWTGVWPQEGGADSLPLTDASGHRGLLAPNLRDDRLRIYYPLGQRWALLSC